MNAPAPPPAIHARPALPVVRALLEAAHLPVEDLAEDSLEHFFYAGDGRDPRGVVGLELHGPDALLRSLVVDARERRRGLGQALVAQAEQHATSQGVRALYLLTTTAEAFFGRLGYARVDRGRAPPSVQRTREFAALCPQSAAFMMKKLRLHAGAP